MSDKRYETREDVNLRLNNTICRYKDEFGIVNTGEKGTLVVFQPYSAKGHAGQASVLDANDASLLITSPSLGYMQYSDYRCAYVTRVPVRRQRQGLSSDNLNMFYVDGNDSGDFRNAFGSSRFFAMLYNSYPTMKEVSALFKNAAIVGENTCSFALSRSFAVASKKGKQYTLLRNNVEVGSIDLETGQTVLTPYWDGDSILIGDIERELKQNHA